MLCSPQGGPSLSARWGPSHIPQNCRRREGRYRSDTLSPRAFLDLSLMVDAVLAPRADRRSRLVPSLDTPLVGA